MSPPMSFARTLRLQRLHRHGDQRLLIVPLDHSVTDGPVTGGRRVNDLVGVLASNGVDAVIVHKGTARRLDPVWFRDLSLIVHLSASTVHASDPDAKVLVTGVEEALRAGADAVSVHINLGSREEKTQIADLASVSEACDRWNVPLLAMMYPRGPSIAEPRAAAVVAHAANLAADLGADLVKTLYTGSPDSMAEITDVCPVPIVVAGGPRRDDTRELLSWTKESLGAGAAGVAVGRNIFQAADPGGVARAVADLVHETACSTRLDGVRS